MRVELPLTEGLPDDVTVMSDRQLELLSRVMRVVWDGDEVTVSGWAFIRNIDLADNPPDGVAELVSADGSTRIPMATETFTEPRLEPQAATGTATTATAGSGPHRGCAGARGRRPGVGVRADHDRGRGHPHDPAPRHLDRRLERRGPDAGRPGGVAVPVHRGSRPPPGPAGRPPPGVRRLRGARRAGPRDGGLPGGRTPSGWWSATSTRTGASCSRPPHSRPGCRVSGGCGSTSAPCRCRPPTRRPPGSITQAAAGARAPPGWRVRPNCWPRRAPTPSPAVVDDPRVVRRLTRSRLGEPRGDGPGADRDVVLAGRRAVHRADPLEPPARGVHPGAGHPRRGGGRRADPARRRRLSRSPSRWSARAGGTTG